MTALKRDPITIDLASPTNYVFIIARAPSIQYFCNSVKLPDIMLPSISKNEPSLAIPFTGDHLIYTPIELTFNVDANFQNWQEILNWMKGVSSPSGNTDIYTTLQTNQQNMQSPYQVYSDLTLVQLDGQNLPLMNWTFKRSHPIALSGPKFTSTARDEQPFMISTTAIKFLDFDIEMTS